VVFAVAENCFLAGIAAPCPEASATGANVQAKLVVIAAAMVVGLAPGPLPVLADATGEIRDQTKIVVVPISDTQRLLERDGRGGYARLSAIVEDERASGAPIIMVHAGNAISPSLFSAIDEGSHAIDALNRLGVTIMAPGSREFDLGPDVAARRFTEARSPVVLTNL